MQILIVANFIRNMPWDSAWWTVVFAREFLAQGHSVRILADGLESPETLAGFESEIVRPSRTHLGANPRSFALRVREARERSADMVTLSLTGWVAGDLWLPLDQTPGQLSGSIFRDLRPLSAALEFIHHPWLIHEAFAHRRAAQEAAGKGTRRLNFGEGESGIGHASGLAIDTRARYSGEAISLRRLMGIACDEPVFVLSAAEVRPHALEPIAQGFTAARSGGGAGAGGGVGARLIVLTRRQHSVSRVVQDAGCGRDVIVMGLSRRVELPLSIAEVAIAGPMSGGVSCGRWVADALRVGLPVVASVDSSGARLAETSGAAMVRAHDAMSWERGFAQALDASWRKHAGERAMEAAPQLSVDAMVARLLATLRSPNS
ncbi:MAG: hypothetical protein AABZ53_13475 [Planctomycetota bacterium]